MDGCEDVTKAPVSALAVAFRLLPTSPSMPERFFASRYCAKYGVLPKRYEQAVLRRSLHLGARLLYPLLACRPSYFAADRELVRAIGGCRTLWDFDTETLDFRNHPDNRGWLRGTLKLRLSVRRLRRLVREVLPPGQSAGAPTARQKK